MERLLRPSGVVINGVLELGIELVLVDGILREVRPHTGVPDPFVVSPAFVNAHSHLEYRGLQGTLTATEYWPWIREIKDAKTMQDLSRLPAEAALGARENRATGVAIVAEHSDRPVSGAAMREAGLGGVIFQEIISRSTPGEAREKAAAAEKQAAIQAREASVPGFPIPHAYQTVDDETLRGFGASRAPFSMHVAESDVENELAEHGSGPIAETYRKFGTPYCPTGKRIVPTLDDLGLVRSGAQFVHCCAIDEPEVALLAARNVAVAHCPRSNLNLGCPIAPVREMLDAGVAVGIGLDSAASSGPIDMFAEMRCALRVSLDRGRPLAAEEVWRLATDLGARSLRPAAGDLGTWRIEPGSSVPLIMIHLPDAYRTEDLVERGRPDLVEWL